MISKPHVDWFALAPVNSLLLATGVALLCAVLATRDLDRLAEIFPQVIDNGKMLRNFVQILRSGITGPASRRHRTPSATLAAVRGRSSMVEP